MAAALSGFIPRTRRVTAGATFVDFVLEIGCLEFVDAIHFSFREALLAADAVVRVRVLSSVPWSRDTACGTTRGREHAVEVAGVLRHRPGSHALVAGAVVHVLAFADAPRLNVGEEYLLPLSSDFDDRYVAWDAKYTLRLREGRAVGPHPEPLPGIHGARVDEAMTALRALLAAAR